MASRNGFTLLELLVVVAIIGLLAAVTLASLNSARDKGDDARRKSDLHTIQTALELYYSKCGTYIIRENCTGTTYGAGGIGWFNFTGYSGAGSLAQGLIDHGVVSGLVIDPSGVTTNSGDRSGYLLYVSGGAYTIWANLRNPSDADRATQDRCRLDIYDDYASAWVPEARMNYCISN